MRDEDVVSIAIGVVLAVLAVAIGLPGILVKLL